MDFFHFFLFWMFSSASALVARTEFVPDTWADKGIGKELALIFIPFLNTYVALRWFIINIRKMLS